jgi:hypothetical protein
MMWQVTSYHTDNGNTDYFNTLLPNLKKLIMEVLHNSENFFWALEFWINQVLLYLLSNIQDEKKIVSTSSVVWFLVPKCAANVKQQTLSGI